MAAEFLTAFREIELVKPWQGVVGGTGLAAELAREAGPAHPLFQCCVQPLAVRIDCDDVLFFTPDLVHPLAVVHLTWRGQMEDDPNRPATEWFVSIEDWVTRRLLPDREAYGPDAEDEE
ncbi:MAG: hypothetical protein K1Y36_07050 [Blastocatellia bacterium]|nr:hypothetical protein [Blastocatellia bacterium]